MPRTAILTASGNQLNAIGTGELIEDLFFVDGRASIMQQNLYVVRASGDQ